MKQYSSGLVAESFWFVEFKMIMRLRNEGKSWEEIKYLCLNENIFGISKKIRTVRMFGYLKQRVDNMEKELIDIFMKMDLNSQKILNLISIAEKNKLFFEFLYEVYRGKILLGDEELTHSDINIFFKNKQEQDLEVASWTDVTLKRLKGTYINFLIDAGLLTRIDKQIKMTPPIIDIEIENFMNSNGKHQYIKALTGEN